VTGPRAIKEGNRRARGRGRKAKGRRGRRKSSSLVARRLGKKAMHK